MITKIRISNFYSIGEATELTFLKGGEKSENNEKNAGYFQYKKSEKISLINGFFGANASGKSSILKAMVTIIRLIYSVNTPKENVNKVLLCRPNMHKKFENQPTKLGIDLLIDSNYYEYDLIIKKGSNIIEEKLYVTTLNKQAAKPKKIFTRTAEKGITFGHEYKDHENYLSIANIEKYQTFISHLINNVGAKAVIDFVNYRKSNPAFLKTDGFDLSTPIPIAIFTNAIRINSFDKEKKEKALKLTKEIMSCFDETIEGLEINAEDNGVSIKVKHKDFIGSVEIVEESAGTRELFCHIYDILNAFKNGGTVIYDETNRYFHPDIEIALLSLFKNKEFNTKNAQLFFASHNHDTMDLLELDQAYIVEKVNSSSSTFKLSDIENVKKRDNVKKKYRLGILGGTPDISLFDYRLKQLL